MKGSLGALGSDIAHDAIFFGITHLPTVDVYLK